MILLLLVKTLTDLEKLSSNLFKCYSVTKDNITEGEFTALSLTIMNIAQECDSRWVPDAEKKWCVEAHKN